VVALYWEDDMSSWQLEERQEEEQLEAALAEAPGISVEDLSLLEYDLQDHSGEDGLHYGYNVYFLEGSDAEVLARVSGLGEQDWFRIGPLGADDGDGEDEQDR
jgi:hypothetical protein